MKAHQNLLIAVICIGINLFIFIVHMEIILVPYIMAIILTLFGVGGYHAGLGISKVIEETRNSN